MDREAVERMIVVSVLTSYCTGLCGPSNTFPSGDNTGSLADEGSGLEKKPAFRTASAQAG